MKKVFSVVFILVITSSFCLAQQKVGWSLGYYCAWNQDGFAPASINWNAFTHISHFALVPNSDGSLNVGANGLSDSYCKAAVAAAHAAKRKIVICVGGSGVDAFPSACSAANIHKFVANLLNFMRQYGYDGIDTDWEQSFDDAESSAFHKELRDSINKITPRPLLTAAVGGYFASDCYFIAPYCDQMNDMSYDVPLSNEPNRIKQFTNLGVPAKILGIGIGIGSSGGMVDGNAAAWTGKTTYAINNGLGGIMEWAVTGGSLQVQCFTALVPYVPAPGATFVIANQPTSFEAPMSLLVKNTGMAGVREICYTVPSSANGLLVDLDVYDMKGALVKTLVHGTSANGSFSVPFPQSSAGAYVAKLSTNSRTEATRAFIVR
jgi:hypothetical protein